MTNPNSAPLAAIPNISPDDYAAFLSDFAWLASAAATDSYRPVLTAIAVTMLGDDLVAYAADGYRLHVLWHPSAPLLAHAMRVGDADYGYIPLPQTVASATDGKPIGISGVLDEARAVAPLVADVQPLEHAAHATYKRWQEWGDDQPTAPLIVEYRHSGEGRGRLRFGAEDVPAASGVIRAEGRAKHIPARGFNTRYLCDALSGFTGDTSIRLDVRGNRIVFGEFGERLAVIMSIANQSLSLDVLPADEEGETGDE